MYPIMGNGLKTICHLIITSSFLQCDYVNRAQITDFVVANPQLPTLLTICFRENYWTNLAEIRKQDALNGHRLIEF